MREVKFRAFDKIKCQIAQVLKLDLWGANFEQRNVYLLNGGVSRHIGEFELMQFTGLKDKNGKEIYEGDVLSEPIQIDEEWTNSAIPVIWSDEKSAFCVDFSFDKDGSFIEYLSENCSEMEIIGNIYENPELLT